MNKYVSTFFIPLYERYLSKLSTSEQLREREKIIDAIFHEREFIEWLRIQYKGKLTEESYAKLSTLINFEKYINVYNKIENRSTEYEKKKIIQEQILSERLIPISKYEYDVDIVEAYFQIKELLDKVELTEGFSQKEQYLLAMKYPISDYCKKNELPVQKVFEIKYPIVVDDTIYGFETYLGRTLIAFDVNKIEAILSYQNSKWKQKELFASFVEHGVYNYVKNNSPFDNNLRLSKIMVWVEKNREFYSDDLSNKVIPHEDTLKVGITKSDSLKDEITKKNDLKIKLRKGNKSNKKKPQERKSKKKKNKVTESNPDLLKTSQESYGFSTKEIAQFHYWPYEPEKLKELYDALVTNDKIEQNDLFVESFKTYKDFPKNGTIWKAKQIQLMFLLYLIYGKKKQHKSLPLHNIAVKLFKKGNEDFYARALNTTFNQLLEKPNGGKKLSLGLQSIQDIFDNLHINQG
jgi:hypothetical protein